MKTESLLKALNLAKPALAGSDPIAPILSHFVFLEDVVFAFNDTVAIVVEEETGLNCAIHGDTLLGLMQAGAAEEFQIKSEGEKVKLKMKSGWAELPTMRASESSFELPDEAARASINLTEAVLTGLQQVMLSQGEDSIKPEFFGVTFSLGSGLRLFSTDNITASCYTVPKIISRSKVAAVLPPQACALILKLAESLGAGKLEIATRTATVSFEGVTLVTRIHEGTPARFEKLFSEHESNLGPIDPAFESCIRRAEVLVSRDPVKECQIINEGGHTLIRASGALGRMEASLKGGKGSAFACVDPGLILRVLGVSSAWGINDGRSLVLGSDELRHVITSAPPPPAAYEKPSGKKRMKSPAEETTDDDIPF